MRVDRAGDVMTFGAAEVGQFFIFYEDNRQSCGMKIVYDSKPVLLSFTRTTQPNVTPPSIHPGGELRDRPICVLRDAVFRPVLSYLEVGSPSATRPGPVIIGEDGTFVRATLAWGPGDAADVNVDSGQGGAVFAHPSSFWTRDWKIVLAGEATEERVLCERGASAIPQA